MRMLQRASDQYTATLDKRAAAEKAAGDATTAGTMRLAETGRAYSAAAAAADRYLGRLSPAISFTNQLTAEVGRVDQAMKGLDRQLASGAVSAEAYNQRMALLATRHGEVTAALAGVTSGAIPTTQALQALSTQAERQLSPAFQGVTRTGNAASLMMRQIGIQSFDVFSHLSAGAPVMTVFIQQGGQIAQVAAIQGGALAALGQVARSTFAAVTSPIGLAITAAAALAAGLYAVGSASEGSARRLNDIQNALRTTRDDYASLADQVDATAKKIAATTGIGSSDALAAGKVLAASPNLTGGADQIEQLTKLSNDLAISLGITLPEAAAKTAAAMADPSAALQKLADERFRTVNQETATYAKRLQDAGNAVGAFAVWQSRVGAATAGASEALTPLGKSLRDLSKSFTDVGQDGRSFADSLGSGITAVAAQFVNRITQIVDAAKWAKGQAEALVHGVALLIGDRGLARRCRQGAPKLVIHLRFMDAPLFLPGLFIAQIGQICYMSKSTDKKVARVIWIKIHDCIYVRAASNN
jgi:hypothetical protein